MAQANSAKLSIVVRSICCSKIKGVDHGDGTCGSGQSPRLQDGHERSEGGSEGSEVLHSQLGEVRQHGGSL
jgi:hypothetical protein